MSQPIFLTVGGVIRLHDMAVETFGGAFGIRDRAGLEAAVFQPQTSFEGEYLYSYPCGMAVAYAYGLAMNHPFLDGNKRTAAAALGVFLLANGWTLRDVEEGDLAGAVIGLVTGEFNRADFEAWLVEKTCRT